MNILPSEEKPRSTNVAVSLAERLDRLRNRIAANVQKALLYNMDYSPFTSIGIFDKALSLQRE